MYFCMFCKNLASLYKNYDAFLIDMYGVLWDGGDFFKGALALLAEMKSQGKKLIILSNTTLTAEQCRSKYQAKGLHKGVHFDTFISSGEAFRRTLKKHVGNADTYFSAFLPSTDIFENSSLTRVDTIEQADFVYVGNVNADKVYFADCLKNKQGTSIPMEDLTSFDYHNIDDFDEVTDILDLCLKYHKTLVIANPDIFALEAVGSGAPLERRPVLCQGAIGELYENRGGKVVYFGKPYQAIYDYAKQFIQPSEKIAMIGDTLWTDILGGNIAGYDSILTLSGVVGRFIEKLLPSVSQSNITDCINVVLRTISTKMTHKNLLPFSQIPTHIVETFA